FHPKTTLQNHSPPKPQRTLRSSLWQSFGTSQKNLILSKHQKSVLHRRE
ncbi:fucosyltransferase, partial [Helicobacter pylori]